MASLPQLSQTQSFSSDQPSAPRTHFCHWDWCRLTFTLHEDLVLHVVHDHIRNAKPVYRRDFPPVLSGLASAEHTVQTSVLSEDPDSETMTPITSSQAIVANESVPSLLAPSFASAAGWTARYLVSRNSTPLKRNYADFTQMSSPATTPPVPSISPSPELGTLIEQATNSKRIRISQPNFDGVLQKPNKFASGFASSSQSQSSMSSYDAVECQLTQKQELESDTLEVAPLDGQSTPNNDVIHSSPQSDPRLTIESHRSASRPHRSGSFRSGTLEVLPPGGALPIAAHRIEGPQADTGSQQSNGADYSMLQTQGRYHSQ